ncbi:MULTISPECIES: resuscitation-promoting factor [unclassified Actinomadura]|uniref:resuscitation-promoting factor n=1 Tax=unclassified Actinomadura TaxID=2626254 RepID=UPI0011EBF9D5|nr:resuscitation-promoting factor [Actinomadura sp. K4S16]
MPSPLAARTRAPRALAPAAVLLAAALLASACGGDGGSAAPKNGVVADAPRTSAPAPRKVVIVVDAKKTETMTTGTTVAQVLEQAKIALGPHDLVKPAADRPAGDVIKIMRLLSDPVTKVVKTPAPTVRKKSSSVPPWSEKELRKGRPGITVVKVAYARRKGRRVITVIAKQVKRKPVARIVAVGPKSANTGSVTRLNWHGLANCESHNNPKAVNPAGYYGLYQFSLSSWASVGGSGKPSDASSAEQTYRAQLLYKRVNGRWQGQWPNCGKFLFS